MKKFKCFKKRAAFTLIEVITTIFIISLLMILVLPNVHRIREFAEKKQSEAFFQNMQNQMDLFKGQYPNFEITVPNLIERGFMSKAQIEQFERERLSIKNNQLRRAN